MSVYNLTLHEAGNLGLGHNKQGLKIAAEYSILKNF